MPVLPVIDLKHGEVVRGVAGRRESYRSVESTLTHLATPSAVATAFSFKLAAHDVYVADLNAIGGAEPDWRSYEQIFRAGLKLWLDCGIGSIERAQLLTEFAAREESLAALIIPLESLPEPAALPELLCSVGPSLGAFSLDLLGGVPLKSSPPWQGLAPLDIAGLAWEAGFRRLLVVDLAQVGVGEGPSVAPLCRKLKDTFPNLELTAGGGVRGPADVRVLSAAGCNRVLAASALHNGSLTAADLTIL